jgi:hypothetical protein
MSETNPATSRLNKRMAELGMCSRREADDWISRGWVKVDGQVAPMGLQVTPQARIDVDRRARGPAGAAGHHPHEQAHGLCQRPGRGRA